MPRLQQKRIFFLVFIFPPLFPVVLFPVSSVVVSCLLFFLFLSLPSLASCFLFRHCNYLVDVEFIKNILWIPGSVPLERTASLSLKYLKAILAPQGGTLEMILGADPRECDYTTQPHLGVSPQVCLRTEI